MGILIFQCCAVSPPNCSTHQEGTCDVPLFNCTYFCAVPPPRNVIAKFSLNSTSTQFKAEVSLILRQIRPPVQNSSEKDLNTSSRLHQDWLSLVSTQLQIQLSLNSSSASTQPQLLSLALLSSGLLLYLITTNVGCHLIIYVKKANNVIFYAYAIRHMSYLYIAIWVSKDA